jgi:hypothetical protein
MDGAAALAKSRRIRQPPRFKRDRAKRRRRRPVDHKLQVDAVVGQLQKVEFFELFLEFANEVRGVLGANSERDYRAGIPQDGMPDVRVELMQILMGDSKADPVLAKLSRACLPRLAW